MNDPLRELIIQFLEIDIEAKLFEARLVIDRYVHDVDKEWSAATVAEAIEREGKLVLMRDKLREIK